jgi:AraC-like DNA-binding protein
MPSAAQTADELGVDVRTLRRHLVAEGTSFQELRDLGLSVTEVARRLGYAETSVFSPRSNAGAASRRERSSTTGPREAHRAFFGSRPAGRIPLGS